MIADVEVPLVKKYVTKTIAKFLVERVRRCELVSNACEGHL